MSALLPPCALSSWWAERSPQPPSHDAVDAPLLCTDRILSPPMPAPPSHCNSHCPRSPGSLGLRLTRPVGDGLYTALLIKVLAYLLALECYRSYAALLTRSRAGNTPWAPRRMSWNTLHHDRRWNVVISGL